MKNNLKVLWALSKGFVIAIVIIALVTIVIPKLLSAPSNFLVMMGVVVIIALIIGALFALLMWASKTYKGFKDEEDNLS